LVISYGRRRLTVLPIASVLDIIYQSVFSTIEKEFGITVKKVLRRLMGCCITRKSLQDTDNSANEITF